MNNTASAARSTALLDAIDRFTVSSGRVLAWCSLFMALLTSTVVVLRYGFSVGSIALHRDFPPRTKAWVDAIGGIVFLLPLCAFIAGISFGYVADAWAIRESSPEPGGIPYLYVLKTLLPLMAVNLAVAGVSDVLRNASLLIRNETR